MKLKKMSVALAVVSTLNGFGSQYAAGLEY